MAFVPFSLVLSQGVAGSADLARDAKLTVTSDVHLGGSFRVAATAANEQRVWISKIGKIVVVLDQAGAAMRRRRTDRAGQMDRASGQQVAGENVHDALLSALRKTKAEVIGCAPFRAKTRPVSIVI